LNFKNNIRDVLIKSARNYEHTICFAAIAFVYIIASFFIEFLRSIFGQKEIEIITRGADLLSEKQLKKALSTKDQNLITWGSVEIPKVLEAQHFIISGTTGSGKTQAINKILDVVEARGVKAVIADPAGGFMSSFYKENDLIFNPFDARSVAWSPFNEIVNAFDAQRLSESAIPEGEGNSKEWNHYARILLSETLKELKAINETSMKKLLFYVSYSDVETLKKLIGETPASILCHSGNEKMLANTRAVIATYLSSWQYLPDHGDFSIRSFISSEIRSKLFLTYKDDQMSTLKSLIATVLDLAIVENLSLKESSEREIFYIFDEFDSLRKLGSVKDGLAKLRKYGGKIILGIQTISQVQSNYGKEDAQTIFANASTKLILRCGDNQTAQYFSDEIGKQEIYRVNTSYSADTKIIDADKSKTTSREIIRQETILDSELMGLPNLLGVLKTPSVIGVINLKYQKRMSRAQHFL